MKIGTALTTSLETILLGVVAYKTLGFWGPATIVGIHVIGTIINTKTRGKSITP